MKGMIYMHEYEITKYGFGIHTFELMIPYMKKNAMNAILERMHKEPSNDFHVDGIVHTKKYPCLRIHLCHNKHKRYIRVIVTANRVLHPEADYLSILNENDDVDLLGMKLNNMLTDIFGYEYGLDKFSLSRIDCCVNVMLSKDFSAERYVKLISRSMKCQEHLILEYDDDSEINKLKNEHSFRAGTHFGAFTAYDKYFQLEDINVNFEAVSDALLRLELEFNRRHIQNTVNDDCSNAEILKFYLSNSRRSFEKFISSRFHKGRYYTVKKMREIIKNSDLKKCEKEHANKHIEAQYNARYYRKAVSKSKKKIKPDKAFYNMLKNFEYLDISPISLSCRDKHGDDSVPSLYELLGFDGQSSVI